jgi:hypothetical protein
MKILGIFLVVLGVGLALWGFQLSDSVGSKLTQVVTGSYSDKVMVLYISAAASLVVGLFLTTKK